MVKVTVKEELVDFVFSRDVKLEDIECVYIGKEGCRCGCNARFAKFNQYIHEQLKSKVAL